MRFASANCFLVGLRPVFCCTRMNGLISQAQRSARALDSPLGRILMTPNNMPHESSKAERERDKTRKDGEEWCSDSGRTRTIPDISLCAVSRNAVTLCAVLRVNAPVVVSCWPFGRNDRQRECGQRQEEGDDAKAKPRWSSHPCSTISLAEGSFQKTCSISDRPGSFHRSRTTHLCQSV